MKQPSPEEELVTMHANLRIEAGWNDAREKYWQLKSPTSWEREDILPREEHQVSQEW